MSAEESQETHKERGEWLHYQDVRQRGFNLWAAAGSPPGHAARYWDQAEREIQREIAARSESKPARDLPPVSGGPRVSAAR